MAKKDFKAGFDGLLQGVGQVPDQPEKTQQRANEAATDAGHETTPARNTTKAGNVRATFIVEADLLDKLKALAYWSRQQQKEIINEALREYLDRYEETNGPINKL